MENSEHSIRIAKFLAQAGIASRRRCEELLAEGRVTVNGKVITTPVCLITPGVDTVCFEGKAIGIAQKEYILLNKPAGYTCTASDPHAKRLIYDLIPKSMKSLFYVGRLDRDTEGLLLLTNDGELCQALTHPSHQIEKKYIALCQGEFTDEKRQRMLDGIWDEGEELRAKSVRVVRDTEEGFLLEVILTEGKNREVRRLCAGVDLEILRLARVAVGPLTLGTLPIAAWRELTSEELCQLRKIIQ